MMTRNGILFALPFVCAAWSPAAAETFLAHELAQKAMELKGPGMRATFRNKVLTVTGEFDRLIDTGYGSTVSVAFQHADTNSWVVTCSFPRSDTPAYDRFALMKRGTAITATGRFNDVADVFLFIDLDDCKAD